MRAYPIWNDVTACIYKSSKSYGVRDTGEVSVRVGTSATNSKLLVKHFTTRRDQGAWTAFAFGYELPDGTRAVVARKWMHNKTREWADHNPAEAEL